MKNLNKYFVIVIAALFLIQPVFPALAYVWQNSGGSSSPSTYSDYGWDTYNAPSYTPTYSAAYSDYTWDTYNSPSYTYTPTYSDTYSDFTWDTYNAPSYTPTYSAAYSDYTWDTYDYGYTYYTPNYYSLATYSSSCTYPSCGCTSSCCGSSCPLQNLVASCTVSPNPAQTNQTVTFNGFATGGNGSYTYSWSGNCSSNSQYCSTSFYNNGTYTATLYITSGGQTSSTTCSVNVQGGNTTISVNKLVKNISTSTGYQESVSANQNDRLGFSIQVTNNGNSTANNVWVSDTLPSQINFAGNTQLDGSYNGGTITSGINIGNLSAGQSRTITFEATLSSGTNNTTLTNYARAWADNVSQVQDTATINVSGSTYTNLSIDKLVKNNTSYTGYQNSINANTNDSISYSIRVYNNGSNSANNVMVRDTLPSGINYVGNLRLDGNYLGGDLNSGVNIGSLYTGQSRTITFDAQVLTNAYNYNYYSNNLVNTATVWADNISQITDTASVNVNGSNQNGIFIINKLVSNLSDGTGWQETVGADPGEIVSFSIQVTATSGNNAQNVYVKDTLPAKIAFYGNLKVDGVVTYGDIISGINIGNLYNGQSKTITFDARVLGTDQFNFGSTQQINTAMAYNTNYSVSDTATVNVNRAGVLGTVTEICTGANPIFIVLMVALFLAMMFYFLLPYLERSNNPTVRKIVGAYYKAKVFITR